jgi:hypothetical protein
MLALDLIDFVVAEGKMPVWTQIASKDFLNSLIGILKTRDAPEVQLKILYLIKKWGIRFESQKEIIPNFSEFYKGLKSAGSIIFPEDYQPEYIKYIGDYQAADLIENKVSSSNEKKSREVNINNYKDDFEGNEISNQNKHKNSSNREKNYYAPDDEKSSDIDKYSDSSNKSYKIDLNADNYDKKYSKLIGKLSIWFENIILANDMIDNTKVGTQVDDGLRYVIENLRTAEKELLIYIQEKVKNEKILELCLGINDDLNKTMTRYDVIRSKSKPEPFVSNFEYKGGNNNHKKSRGNKNRHSDRGKSSSRSPNRVTDKKSQKQSTDPFDVFDMKNEVSNISGNKSKGNNNSSGGGNVKSLDDIFEIFGGNMDMNANTDLNTNNGNIKDLNLGNINKNPPQNIDFSSFSNQQGQGSNFSEPVFNLVSGGNSNQINNQYSNPNEFNFNLQSNSQNNNAKPGIDSLAEKLKNIYNNKEDDNVNNPNHMTNNKTAISPNMNNIGPGVGIYLLKNL